MRVLDRLDDLDRKVLGIGRGANPKRWWVWMLIALALVGAVAYEISHGGQRWSAVFDAAWAVGAAFRAGTMYEANLRNRGLRSSWAKGSQLP
jgi:hypothetical protein